MNIHDLLIINSQTEYYDCAAKVLDRVVKTWHDITFATFIINWKGPLFVNPFEQVTAMNFIIRNNEFDSCAFWVFFITHYFQLNRDEHYFFVFWKKLKEFLFLICIFKQETTTTLYLLACIIRCVKIYTRRQEMQIYYILYRNNPKIWIKPFYDGW